MAAHVSGAGGLDEPFADFSRGASAEVTLRAGNSRREPASNFSIQDKRQTRSRAEVGEAKAGAASCARNSCAIVLIAELRTTRPEWRAS